MHAEDGGCTKISLVLTYEQTLTRSHLYRLCYELDFGFGKTSKIGVFQTSQLSDARGFPNGANAAMRMLEGKMCQRLDPGW